MKLYEVLRRKALKNRDAVKYYAFCMSLKEVPEDIELYKEGYKQVYGREISNKKLEKILNP